MQSRRDVLIIGCGASTCLAAAAPAYSRSALPKGPEQPSIPKIYQDISPSRVSQIATLLPEHPQGLGRTASEREPWSALSTIRHIDVPALISAAEAEMQRPATPWDDDAYLEYSRTGERPRGQAMIVAAQRRLDLLTLAECVEGRGRFLPLIHATLMDLAERPSWVLPAHDTDLRNFARSDYTVDLNAAILAGTISQCLYLLGDDLSTEVRRVMKRTIQARIFDPVLQSLIHGAEPNPGRNWWLTSQFNWNVVCLEGVTACALTSLEDRDQRALFVAAAEVYSRNFVQGMGVDGYSSEGPHYWGYGMQHFLGLRELVMQATSGSLDLAAHSPRIAAFASYPYRVQMPNGVAAGFGDTALDLRFSPAILAYVNTMFAMGRSERLEDQAVKLSTPLLQNLHILFDKCEPVRRAAPYRVQPRLSDYFPVAGMLVSRAGPGERLSVSIKAGGNSMSHSHDDIGSYAIAVGVEQLTGDPGMPRYSARTFGPDRRSIKAINSFGHPLPRPADRLQIDGQFARPRVLSIQQSEARDRMLIDLAPAYDLATLRRLTREMVHRRGANEEVRLTDRFAFTQPEHFETAIICGGWRQLAPDRIEVWRGQERVQALLLASAPIDLLPVQIDEEGIQFTRLAVRLKQPSKRGFVSVVFTSSERAVQ